MEIIVAIMVFWIVTMISATILLIQAGGWLSVLVAILNLIFFIIINSIITVSAILGITKKEENKDEGIRA